MGFQPMRFDRNARVENPCYEKAIRGNDEGIEKNFGSAASVTAHNGI
jgi:hypothetical protein